MAEIADNPHDLSFALAEVLGVLCLAAEGVVHVHQKGMELPERHAEGLRWLAWEAQEMSESLSEMIDAERKARIVPIAAKASRKEAG